MEYAPQEISEEMLEYQLDDAQSRQRVSRKLFAEHSVTDRNATFHTSTCNCTVSMLSVCVTD